MINYCLVAISGEGFFLIKIDIFTYSTERYHNSLNHKRIRMWQVL